MRWFLVGLLWTLVASVLSKNRGFGPGKQDYGYVQVRDGAHMFWWLYHTTANVSNSSERPLILWLQGGPGGSSTGIGNFELIGPLDLHLKPRNHTWVNDFNVLFVDNPVGTGFSYVEDLDLLTTNNEQIARDLVRLMAGFYEELPQFKTTPFYVYGQSYGGKMAVDFAQLLYQEVLSGNIECNVSGVAMGNAWISPLDSTLSWAPFLYQVSLVDARGEDKILRQALYTKEVYDRGEYAAATQQWANTQFVADEVTGGVDFYNVLNKVERREKNERSHLERAFDLATHSEYYNDEAFDLLTLMNGPVRQALDIPDAVYWGSQSFDVFIYLEGDFMKPVTRGVERLLNETRLKVHVYNGNVDLICDTPGQMIWVDELKWTGRDEFQMAPRKTIWAPDLMEGYEKTFDKFSFFWINVAGHSVPSDNPVGMRAQLKSMTGF